MLTLPRDVVYLLEELEELLALAQDKTSHTVRCDPWCGNAQIMPRRMATAAETLRQARRKLEELADELRRP